MYRRRLAARWGRASAPVFEDSPRAEQLPRSAYVRYTYSYKDPTHRGAGERARDQSRGGGAQRVNATAALLDEPPLPIALTVAL